MRRTVARSDGVRTQGRRRAVRSRRAQPEPSGCRQAPRFATWGEAAVAADRFVGGRGVGAGELGQGCRRSPQGHGRTVRTVPALSLGEVAGDARRLHERRRHCAETRRSHARRVTPPEPFEVARSKARRLAARSPKSHDAEVTADERGYALSVPGPRPLRASSSRKGASELDLIDAGVAHCAGDRYKSRARFGPSFSDRPEPRGAEPRDRARCARARARLSQPRCAGSALRARRRPCSADRVGAVRIALLSPYSWTYPGGVTRHIEALAARARAAGPRARASSRPFDPDDALSRAPAPRRAPAAPPTRRRLRLARADRRHPRQRRGLEHVAHPARGLHAARASCATGGYDVVHIHEPVVPVLGWDALCSAGELPLVGTFHTYSENALTNGIAAVAARRAPAHEPAARAHRRLRGRGLDGAALLRRALPDHPQRRAPAGEPSRRARRPRGAGGRAGCASCSSARPSSARACRSCCAPSRRCASTSRRR